MKSKPLTREQAEGRRVFDAVVRSSKALIEKGLPPGAVVAGLLGVVTELSNHYIGRRETRRVLMTVAEANTDDPKH